MYRCPEYNKLFESFVSYSEQEIGYYHESTCPFCHQGEDEILESHSLTMDVNDIESEKEKLVIMDSFVETLIDSQVDLDPESQHILNENFWDCIP